MSQNLKQPQTVSSQQDKKVKKMIADLDLTSVLQRLIKIDKWNKEEAIVAIKQYRNFLYLKYKFPQQILPPSYEIDEVWHAHILHTKDYCHVCHLLYGKFLHHYPQSVEQSHEKVKMQQLFDITQELYYQEFGTYIYAVKKNFFYSILSKIVINMNNIISFFFKNKKDIVEIYRHKGLNH